MKILAIRLDAAGDVLMCTPALTALAAKGHYISLLTSESGAEVGRRLDSVREVIVWAAPWMKVAPRSPSPGLLTRATLLADRQFDVAVIFTSYSQSPLPAAMLCHLAGIPRCLAHCRENPYQLLSDWVREPEPEHLIRHEVQRQLDLVAHMGCRRTVLPAQTRLQLRITSEDYVACRSVLRQAGVDDDEKFMLLHPGATATSRRYPEAQWAEVISLLSQAGRMRLIIAGDAKDHDLIGRIISLADGDCISLAGMLNFGELAALIASAALLISNNSAPAHLAAVSGTPVVVLYALTNPQHTPWQVPSRILFYPVACHTCYQSICPQRHHRCLAGITPRQVTETVMSLLEEDESRAKTPRSKKLPLKDSERNRPLFNPIG